MTWMRRPLVLGLLLLAALASLPWLSWLVGMAMVLRGPSYDEVQAQWNQRLTITLDTPLGERSGSAVQHIFWAGPATKDEGKPLGDGAHSAWTVTGEAVVVEVSPGKYLFALLKAPSGFIGDPGKNLAYALLQSNGTKGYVSSEATINLIKALPLEQPVPLPPKAWPLMVTFSDIADPKSVQRVDPEDLAASFGPGVRLKAVTLEVTDEAVTEGKVEAVLGWLEEVGRDRANLKGKPAVGLVSDQADPQVYLIAPSHFSTELYK